MADKKENKEKIFDLDMDLAKPFKELMGSGEIDAGLDGLDPIKKGQENLRDAGDSSRSKAKKRSKDEGDFF